MTAHRLGFYRWLFEDRRTGRLVIAQMPNALMWVVLGALAFSFIAPAGRMASATRVVLFVSLAFWALDEATRGVNPWRRVVGLATLLGIVVWLVARR